ncbi:MAG: DNA adenine methylase [Clostridium sp.]|nr:DNA adenine methylase [Clostridium sp.]
MPQGEEKRKPIAPVVKWAGGKRRLLERILPLVPEHETYYEPFFGGGAVLFALQPEKAVINDSNADLMDIYRVIASQPEELISLLEEHAAHDSKDYYYEVRALDRDFDRYEAMTDTERAARFLYLNKTCFNGLFRVNRSGEFNVPYGRYKNPEIVGADGIRAMSSYLNRAKIRMLSQDYREVFRGIRENAFVYLDPPYMPISETSSFTGYTAAGFDRQQQTELKKQCDKLNRRGVKFMLSNSCCDFIIRLYRDYRIEHVNALRSVNARADGRGKVEELLIMNY